MKPKTMILLVVAVGCGLAAAVISTQIMPSAAPEVQAEEVDTVPVLIAMRDLAPGIQLTNPEKLFREEMHKKSDLPRGPVGEFTKVSGFFLKHPLKENQPLIESDLTSAEELKVTQKLDKGERAVTVKVTSITGTGGFIMPGDRVDVVGTLPRGRGGRGDEAFSQTILQDIQVLAIEADTRVDESTRSKPVDHVTLRVLAEQVEILAAYEDSGAGTLRIVPRPEGDTTIVQSKGASPSSVLKQQEERELDPQAIRREVSSLPVGPSLEAPNVPDQVIPRGVEVVENEAPAAPEEPKKHVMVISDAKGYRTVEFDKESKEAGSGR